MSTIKLLLLILFIFLPALSALAATRTIANGGGNWSSTGTWVEGAVPTSADDVVATATSGNVTINAAAACRSIDMTNYVGTLTHNAGIILSVGNATGGAFTFVSGMTYSPVDNTAQVSFVSTSNNGGSGWPVTTAGKLMGNLYFNAIGGKWVLQDDLTSIASASAALNWGSGDFNSNGKTIDYGLFSTASAGSVRTITISNSVIYSRYSGSGVAAWRFTGGPTLVATGSSIRLTGSTGLFQGNGQTYGEVQLNGTSNTIVDSNTFTTLTRTSTATLTDSLTLTAGTTQTIAAGGTLNLNGNSATNRLFIGSSTLGTAGTISVPVGATINVSNADFRDVTGTGGHGWDISSASGGSGDCGGNSGITFTTAATQYWKTTTTGSKNWSDSANWFLATNGGGGAGHVPLPQDDVVFDANSIGATSTTVLANMPRLGKSISWTGATNTPAFSLTSTSTTLYGSLTLVSGMTLPQSQSITFEGRGAYTLTSAGKSFTSSASNVIISMIGGSLTLQDNLSLSSGNSRYLYVNYGTFNANGFNVSLAGLISSNSNVRTINMGSGTWTILDWGTTPWNLSTTTNLTFNAGTSTIVWQGTSNEQTFQGGGLTYNNLTINSGTANAKIFSGSNTFNNFTINAPKTVKFTSGTTQTITGNFIARGTSGNVITVSSTTGASAFTLSKSSGEVLTSYLSLQDSTASGGARWIAAGATNVSGNTGWIFANARTIADGGGNWSATGTWVEGAVPTSSDVVIATATSGNLTIDAAAACAHIDLTNYVGTLTHNTGITLSVGNASLGSLLFVSGMTYSAAADTSAISFVSTTTGNSLTSGGKLLGNLTFNGAGGGWALQDTLTAMDSTQTLTLTQGSLNTNGQAVTVGKFSSSNSNVRTLSLGASSFTCNSVSSTPWTTATSANMTLNAGTSTIYITGTGSVFNGGGITTFNNVVFSGSGTNDILGSNTFNNFTVTGASSKTGVCRINANQTITGTLTINGDSITNRLLVTSETLGTARSLIAANVSVTNADFRDITGAGAGNWDLSAITGLSGDCGGNSGITFTPAATQTWTNVNGGNWSDVFNWSGRVPLPQDDVSMTCAFADYKTITPDMPRLGKTIDFSGATFAHWLSWPVTSMSVTLYGSLIFKSGMLVSLPNNLIFEGRGIYTLNMAGVRPTTNYGIVVNMYGGVLRLASDLLLDAGDLSLTLTHGTFDATNNNTANYNVSLGAFASSNSNTRSLIMGSGTWTIARSWGTRWDIGTSTGMTLVSTGSTIIMSYTGATNGNFAGGGLTYNNLSITGGGAGILTFSGSNTFNNFTINAPKTVKFTAGTTQTITGNFTATGTAGNMITMDTNTGAGTFTLSKSSGTVLGDFLSLSRSTATGGAVWYAKHSTDGGSNTGWKFKLPPSAMFMGGM